MRNKRGAGGITSVDVARAAGVSQSVVSRAFSNSPSVSAATRALVLETARRLGYRHNQLARGLIADRSNLLALVAGEPLANPLHLRLIEAFTHSAQAAAHRVLLFCATDGQSLDDALMEVLAYRPAGILALAGTPSAATVDECHASAVPVVLVGRDAGRTAASWVSCDNEAEARRIAQLLLAAGHRRFGFVASRHAETEFGSARERGFCDAVVQAGCAAPASVNGGSTYEGGYAAAAALLAPHDGPEAIFCAGDAMALGLLDAARRNHGVAVPQQLSVVGFDDVPMAAWASYELTTVRQRVAVMAQEAVALLLRGGAAAGAPPVHLLVPGDLVVRGSARLADAAGSATGELNDSRRLSNGESSRPQVAPAPGCHGANGDTTLSKNPDRLRRRS